MTKQNELALTVDLTSLPALVGNPNFVDEAALIVLSRLETELTTRVAAGREAVVATDKEVHRLRALVKKAHMANMIGAARKALTAVSCRIPARTEGKFEKNYSDDSGLVTFVVSPTVTVTVRLTKVAQYDLAEDSLEVTALRTAEAEYKIACDRIAQLSRAQADLPRQERSVRARLLETKLRAADGGQAVLDAIDTLWEQSVAAFPE